MNRKTITVKTAAFVFLLAVCANTAYAEGLADRDASEIGTPQTAEGFLERGYAYRKKGDLNRAIVDYESALEFAGPDTADIFKSFLNDAKEELGQ